VSLDPENGQGTTQDYAEAPRWYRKAADQGNALALGAFATMYEKGLGVAQDHAEAERLALKASAQLIQVAKEDMTTFTGIRKMIGGIVRGLFKG
jgi:TPR repeat protein